MSHIQQAYDNRQVTLNAIVFHGTPHVTVTNTLARTDYPDLRHPGEAATYQPLTQNWAVT
jgi:hypothetical protein